MSKTVFITGASTGIGLASAKLFYERGWNVVATMRSPDKDTELRQLDSSKILVVRLDVSDVSTIQSAVDAALAKFGGIDLLVNNAGYGQNGLFELISREQIQAQFDVNVFGVMEVTRAVLPYFRARQAGGIVNVSSGAGIFGLPFISIYNASKFALEGFTESLSYELASQGVFVKSVIPHGGVTSTNFGQTGMALTRLDASAVPSYGPFLQKTLAKFGEMAAASSISSDDVARKVYEAATDGKDTLRYYIGDDSKRGFISARYKSASDEEYMRHMRSFFS